MLHGEPLVRCPAAASGSATLNNTTRSELWGPAANTAAYCTHATGYLNSTGGSTSSVC